MRALTLRAGVFGLLLLLGGCHHLFGDFTLVEDSASCVDGAARCAGNVLQRCNESATWDNAAVCSSETLCDSSGNNCLPPQCAAGEWQCLGADLQICNGTRDGWITLTSCATAGHCSTRAGMCTEVPCEPGQIQCNGAVLQSCKEDRSGWNDEMRCPSAALCNEDDGKCEVSACQLGQFRCQGAELQTCTDTLDAWTTIKSCHSEALCDESTGQCGTEACTNPGAFRCGGDGTLERCADDLTGWTFQNTCKSVAHCDAVNGTCMEEPCTPGQYQCSGAQLEICNTERTGWDPIDTCVTDALCQLTLSAGSIECQEPACGAGEFKCDDGQPLICNAGRTAFRENGAACLTAELCNGQQGTCSPAACDPGNTRCAGAQPEICSPARTGYVANGAACASDALCNPETGTCGDARCVEGQLRCDPENPTTLQRCASDLSGWDTCDTCATGELCSASLSVATSCDDNSCIEPTCELTHRWCGGIDSKTLYQCPASRINAQAVVVDVCDTSGLCELAHADGLTMCPEPTCAPTDRWCGGSGNRTLYQCPASRINSEPDVVDVCETSGLCDLAHSQGTPMCPDPECASGEKRCDETELQVCNSALTGWTDLDTCASSTLCMNSLMPSSQMTCDACVDGSTRCDGAQPQTCSDPGTGPAVWADSGDACDAAALCDAATGACLCSLGDTRCHPTTDNFEECQATGWVETDVCTMGCDAATGCLVEDASE